MGWLLKESAKRMLKLPLAARLGRPLSTTPGAIRSRRWRARQKRSKAVAPVEYDGEVLNMLVRLGWLGEHEVGDPKEIGRAIGAMVKDAAV
jgi:hypothetical protein